MPPLRRIYSKPGPVPLDETKPFQWHVVAFRGLRSGAPALSLQTYTLPPIFSVPGWSSTVWQPPLNELAPQLYKHISTYGEQCVFQITDEERNETTCFVEVLNEKDVSLSLRCKEFKELVEQYLGYLTTEQDLAVPSDIYKQQQLLFQEHMDYTCIVFYCHWFRESLETVMDPRTMSGTSDERRAALSEVGGRFRKNISTFLDMLDEQEGDISTRDRTSRGV